MDDAAPAAKVTIYGLADPRTNQVRYIGKANDPKKRLASHLRDSRRRRTRVYIWINQLLAAGELPALVELECCDPDGWPEVERRWIAEARARGDDLLNMADGGDEPGCSRETRAANAVKNTAAREADPFRKRIWSLKQRMGMALRKGYVPEEVKAKLRYCAIKAPHLFGEWANL